MGCAASSRVVQAADPSTPGLARPGAATAWSQAAAAADSTPTPTPGTERVGSDDEEGGASCAAPRLPFGCGLPVARGLRLADQCAHDQLCVFALSVRASARADTDRLMAAVARHFAPVPAEFVHDAREVRLEKRHNQGRAVARRRDAEFAFQSAVVQTSRAMEPTGAHGARWMSFRVTAVSSAWVGGPEIGCSLGPLRGPCRGASLVNEIQKGVRQEALWVCNSVGAPLYSTSFGPDSTYVPSFPGMRIAVAPEDVVTLLALPAGDVVVAINGYPVRTFGRAIPSAVLAPAGGQQQQLFGVVGIYGCAVEIELTGVS